MYTCVHCHVYYYYHYHNYYIIIILCDLCKVKGALILAELSHVESINLVGYIGSRGSVSRNDTL